ncbi:MAG: hypothetical protein Q9227_004526 [Pyrenula ochraceoflavens]
MSSSHPDASLHPHATGLAAKLVSAHSSPSPSPGIPTLYSGWFCPFVQRAWLTLEEKHIPYTYVEVNPYHKPQSLLSLNPRGLVPTLGVPTITTTTSSSSSSGPSTKPLFESNVICEYLDEVYSDKAVHGPSLFPPDAYEKARVKIWIDFITSRIIPAYHRFLQCQDTGSELDKLRSEFHGHLKTWIREADPVGPFFSGAQFSMPDIALAPWAVRLWVFDHFKKGGLGIPDKGQGGGEDEGVWERWRKWVEAVEGRESVKGTMSERGYYVEIYRRYAEGRAMSELAKAVRAGKGVP